MCGPAAMQARWGLSLQNSWMGESHGEEDKIHENNYVGCLDEQVLGHKGTFDKNTVNSLVNNHPWSKTK